jgi:hypothetical protein
MTLFNTSELKRYVIGGLVGAGLGGAALGVSYLAFEPDSNAADYVLALRVAGWVLLIGSLLWTALAGTRLWTRFFALDQAMEPQTAVISLVVIVGILTLFLAAIIPQFPTTPIDKLPQDPKVRERILVIERTSKVFFAAMVGLAGGVVAFFPIARWIRKPRSTTSPSRRAPG